MAELDALFRRLSDAPPRSAEIVRRAARGGMPALAARYDIDEAQARVLLFRALLDVQRKGPVTDHDEPGAIDALFDASKPSEARAVLDQVRTHQDALDQRFDQASAAFAASPDRDRDERFRWIAIVVVLVLTGYFYWREKTKPLPPPERRPGSTQTP